MATGVNVSKANVCGAVSPPKGVNVSKASVLGAITPPVGLSAAKVVVYIAISTQQPQPVIQFCCP